MRYPVAFETGNINTAYGIIVPDLPGCFSAYDSNINEAIENAKEAIEAWIETALDLGQQIPQPSSVTLLQKQKEFNGWIWLIVEIKPTPLSNLRSIKKA